MRLSVRQMLFILLITLGALIVNYSLQNRTVHKGGRRKRAFIFDKNEVVKNILLARAKDPKFLDVISKKIETNTLKKRERLIYIDALGTYDSKRSTGLMWTMYQQGGVNEHGHIIKGLGKTTGEFNKSLLKKIYEQRLKLNESEMVFLYISIYQQFSGQKWKKEARHFLEKRLDLQNNLNNLPVLRFFYEEDILSPITELFSKRVINLVIKGGRISPVLFNFAVKILLKQNPNFIRENHSDLMTLRNSIYIRYYIPTIRLSCFPGVTSTLLKRLSANDLPFDLFRPIVAELKQFGGIKLKLGLKDLFEQQDISERKKGYLGEVLKRFPAEKRYICKFKKSEQRR